MREFEITPIPAFRDNYIWTIVNKAKKKAIVIDPGDSTPVKNFLESHDLSLSAILITHHHADHTGGVGPLLSNNIPVYGPCYEEISVVTHKLDSSLQAIIDDYNLYFKIFHVPGHTKGHITYLYQDILFCGDTLFSAGCGRIFEGTAEQMFQSLNKLKSLDKATKIYPAHEYTLANLDFALAVEPDNDYIKSRIDQCENLRNKGIPTLPSTIDIELKTNPFLRYSSTLVNSVSDMLGIKVKSEFELFKSLRKLKDNW